MKKILTSIVIVAVVLGTLGSFSPALSFKADAAVTDWQKGASISPETMDDFGSANTQQSLRNLKAMGANYVAFMIPYTQSNTSSSDIGTRWNTPTDSSLISAINYAHSIGLKVNLTVHLETNNGDWRATINANDRNTWFSKYGAILNHLGDIGKQTGVEEICIGTELISMSTFTSNSDNTARWTTMIQNLRTHFNGLLTYGANWGSGSFAEEPPHVGFWGSLDLIGISAYYELAPGQNNPSVDALKSSWDSWNSSKIKPLFDQYHKPILFTEIGYKSIDNAHSAPWDSGKGGNTNMQEQVNDYNALMGYWNNYSYMAGIQIWDWKTNPNYGGTSNSDYSPQNKPAQDTIKQWFTQGAPVTPPPPPPPSGAWSASASASGNQVGSPVTFNLTVNNTGQASGVIVDAEIYDQGNNKVQQKFFENQTISGSQPGNYQVSWTPSSAGNYTLKVGVFNNNWSQNLYWNNGVTTATVGQNTPPPPPPPPPATTTPPTNPPPPPPQTSYDTNIWWPSNGASVTGVQPFKAQVINRDVSQYDMFWQVDGGQLNQMSDSNQDYPHKESLVDLSGWKWKGSGPYTINFVSKDKSTGTVISQKSANITVQ